MQPYLMTTPDQMPCIAAFLGGQGVAAQRRQFPINGKKTRGKDIPLAQYEGNVNTPDQIPGPIRGATAAGEGVSAQRQFMEGAAHRPIGQAWQTLRPVPLLWREIAPCPGHLGAAGQPCGVR